MEHPAAPPFEAHTANPGGPIRVMLVDDSSVIRTLIGRCLDNEPDISVVHLCRNGFEAIEALKRAPCEVVVLDIEMPDMDGLEALPKLLEIAPDLQVVMASTLTHRNAATSLQALDMGAADYLPKPQANDPQASRTDFQKTLIEKIRALGVSLRRKDKAVALRPSRSGSRTARPDPIPGLPKAQTAIRLRPMPTTRPDILAIGSSTGGPQAVKKLLAGFPVPLGVPIVITQHMPATFTSMFANHLGQIGLMPCAEAKDGDPVLADRIYVAPGNWHMRVERSGNGPVIRLNQDPPMNFCRPAVDALFASLSQSYGAATLCVVLTGMGSDGRDGARRVVREGGTILAQDEASSVVWGMPGAVAMDGLCSRVEPVEALCKTTVDVIKGVG